MAKRVAVVTDAMSEQFCFPYWHRYYGELFGAQNLFVITYSGRRDLFAQVQLGGLVELPSGYEDQLRARVISRFVTTLLACYDLVIRADTDEFLVVDPSVAATLADYVETLAEPYLTARGFDVIQLPGEPPLNPRDGLPLLRDRGYAYPNTALNKTCITAIPMQWSAGFHWATVFPKFGPVFILHMKRIDVGWQLALLREVTSDIARNPHVSAESREYYAPDEQKILAYHAGVDDRPRLSGIGSWYRSRLTQAFIAEIRLDGASLLYHGQYGHEHVLF